MGDTNKNAIMTTADKREAEMEVSKVPTLLSKLPTTIPDTPPKTPRKRIDSLI
jgi:hypothetical protein